MGCTNLTLTACPRETAIRYSAHLSAIAGYCPEPFSEYVYNMTHLSLGPVPHVVVLEFALSKIVVSLLNLYRPVIGAEILLKLEIFFIAMLSQLNHEDTEYQYILAKVLNISVSNTVTEYTILAHH